MKRKAFSCAVLSMATALLIPGISLASPANTIGQWFNRSGKWYYGKDEDSLRKEWIVLMVTGITSTRTQESSSPDG